MSEKKQPEINKLPKENIKLADSFASEYDKTIIKNDWKGPEILFDLLQKRLQSFSKILDLGIGTGESSAAFQKAGHKIFGIDSSEKMLDQCKSKNIAKELHTIDLETEDLPFPENSFQAIISNGVFHLINPLELIFSESRRILTPNGYFVFTYQNASDVKDYKKLRDGVWEKKTATGVYTYKHEDLYIENLLQKNAFHKFNYQKFLAFKNTELNKNFYFTALLAQLE